jgi:hypothetical protein
MRVLKAVFKENIFSANFPSVSIFQCKASKRSPLASGRVRLRRPDGQVTRRDAQGLVACLCGNARPDGLVMRPDRDPTGLNIMF